MKLIAVEGCEFEFGSVNHSGTITITDVASLNTKVNTGTPLVPVWNGAYEGILVVNATLMGFADSSLGAVQTPTPLPISFTITSLKAGSVGTKLLRDGDGATFVVPCMVGNTPTAVPATAKIKVSNQNSTLCN